MASVVAMCVVLIVVVVVVVAVVVVMVMVAPSAAAARAMAPAGAPGEASTAEQLCNMNKLIVCEPAIIVGMKPSESCCSNLRAHEGCFCQYAKDPALSPFINSPKARKTLTSCGITLPTCSK